MSPKSNRNQGRGIYNKETGDFYANLKDAVKDIKGVYTTERSKLQGVSQIYTPLAYSDEIKLKLYSYKDIEKEYGLPQIKASKIAYKLQVERVVRGGKSLYPIHSVKQIIDFQPQRRKLEHHRRKITIIEEYLRQPSARKVANFLRIQKELVNKTVKEWEANDGYITVESSLNLSAPYQIKNIQRRGSKWLYSFTHNGVRYYKGSFETEDEAFEAMQGMKLNLKD